MRSFWLDPRNYLRSFTQIFVLTSPSSSPNTSSPPCSTSAWSRRWPRVCHAPPCRPGSRGGGLRRGGRARGSPSAPPAAGPAEAQEEARPAAGQPAKRRRATFRFERPWPPRGSASIRSYCARPREIPRPRWTFRFERRLRRRSFRIARLGRRVPGPATSWGSHRVLGGGFGRGAKPPSESPRRRARRAARSTP